MYQVISDQRTGKGVQSVFRYPELAASTIHTFHICEEVAFVGVRVKEQYPLPPSPSAFCASGVSLDHGIYVVLVVALKWVQYPRSCQFGTGKSTKMISVDTTTAKTSKGRCKGYHEQHIIVTCCVWAL